VEEDMPTSLREVAEQAKRDKGRRFTNLNTMLNEEFLIESFKLLKKKAAAGVDGKSVKEYGAKLEANVARLVETLKKGQYHARLVRRKYIKKPNGKMRPLGILTVEDKLLQAAVARILGAIYEQDFTQASYGYRPRRGAQTAVKELTYRLQHGKNGYVVEADIKGFFDHINHETLLEMLNLRIGDGPIKQLIRRWLTARILEEDGTVIKPIEGTPQGGVISPILANIYLHYVLDLWFEKVAQSCEGETSLIRYADDFVAVFQYRRDAEKYLRALGERLKKFGLELAIEKTRIVSFSRFRKEEKSSFNFLGIEFRWGESRNGKDIIKRRTDRSRFRRAVEAITNWCKTNRSLPTRKQAEKMRQKLYGHYNYYGIIGNYLGLKQFYSATMRAWHKWLNRRSQRKSLNWKQFEKMIERYRIPKPRIVEQRIVQLSLPLA
jgi:group II intron reverse transcriptase/maturase